MTGSATRIARKLAAATAALLTVGVVMGAGPAHAASTDPPVDGTPAPVYVVDEDPIAIDSNYTVFSGTMKSFHDSAHLRATLRGTLKATQQDKCIRLAVTFFYADGTHDNVPWDNHPYPCGTSTSSLTISSPVNKDIVKYNYSTRAITAGGGPFSDSGVTEGLVGDAPASVGTCTQLDKDSVGSSGTNLPTFDGQVRYGCMTTTGTVVATLSGTLDKSRVPSGSTGSVEVTFTYADGTSSTQRTPGGTPKLVSDDFGGSYYAYPVGASSDQSKDVRSVTVRALAQSNFSLRMTAYAPQSTYGASWFGTFNYS